MKRPSKVKNKQSKLYRSLITTLLLANGIFQLVAPALAEGTAAGQDISNTATATYEDPNSPGTTINATSNTVVVTVAEVAGITVAASGTGFKTDTDGTGSNAPGTPDGKINVGDTLYYNYTIKNVGNDPTKFRIPNLATVQGSAKVDGNLEISYDGGASWTPISGGELITTSIAPDASVLVRVPVLITSGVKEKDIISVKLGDTPGDGQNQLRQDSGGDVYTVDNNDPTSGNIDPATGEVKGIPSNGVREASKTQSVTVGSTATTKALATILKTMANHNPGDLTKLDDDVLTYGLTLRVEGSDTTNSGITPSSLAGTDITVDNSPVTRILVSDAIPSSTVLDPNTTPTAPSGWQVVYTISPTSTSANQADWKTTKPTGTITRVGFITKTETSIAPGEEVKGFTISVKSTVNTKIVITNIAQLFGKTASDPTSPIIYDESGDQNPTNFNPDDKTFTTFNPATDTGYIPPASNTTDANNNGIPDELENGVGVDLGNNNTGSGSSGEANVFILQNPAATSVLTGPQNAPDAVGPNNDNNKDFTNKSALIPANTAPLSKIDPSGVSFTNTLQNTGTSDADISLIPTALENKLDLPNGTLVTISKGSLSATYKYDQANNKFDFQSGQGTVGANPISATNPVRVDGVKPGEKVDYGVEINLPANTPLSTDTIADYPNDKEFGFPVPITGFIDNGPVGLDASDPQNTTIDRVYTGFLKMLKESRVLQGTGPAVQGNDGTFSSDTKKPAPGNIVEYQVSYKNISTLQAGTGNVILKANKVVITEDGTAKPNNWALDNDGNGEIDTSNIVSSAKDPNGNIKFFPAGDQTGVIGNADVTKYIDEVTDPVLPGEEKKFVFQRLVNGTKTPSGKANNLP